MQRPNYRWGFKDADQRPNEGHKAKIGVQHEDHDLKHIPEQHPSKARAKVGFSSEHYHHAVAELAYGFWEQRGHGHGGSNADWFKAEAALRPLWSADQPFASMADDPMVDRASGLSGMPNLPGQK